MILPEKVLNGSSSCTAVLYPPLSLYGARGAQDRPAHSPAVAWRYKRHQMQRFPHALLARFFSHTSAVVPTALAALVTERGKAIFVAATKEHTGKTSVSMALIAGLVRR